MLRSALLGRSIGASRSPWLHEQEARAQGLSLSYELFDFTDRGWSDADLKSVVDRLRDQAYCGFNLTYPFKQVAMDLLDDLDEEASMVGAVNTVAIRNGRLTGFNTDMTGFRDSISAELPDGPLERVLQLGAGGAGSAVAVALLSLGVQQLSIRDVDPARSLDLVERLAARFGADRVIQSLPDDAAAASADGLVNCTPIGMDGKPGMPISPAALRPDMWVADIIYFPRETALLAAARERGCRTINGVGMVIGQAARAFSIMTGLEADKARMECSFGETHTN